MELLIKKSVYQITIEIYIEHTKFTIEGFVDYQELMNQFLLCLQQKALGADVQNFLAHIAIWMDEYFLGLNQEKIKILVMATPSPDTYYTFFYKQPHFRSGGSGGSKMELLIKKVLLKGGGSHSEKFSPILLFSVEPYSQNGCRDQW